MRIEPPSGAGPAQQAQPRIGAQVIVDALLDHGVETVVNSIRSSLLPLPERLYDARICIGVPCHEPRGWPHGRCAHPAERVESGRRAVETS